MEVSGDDVRSVVSSTGILCVLCVSACVVYRVLVHVGTKVRTDAVLSGSVVHVTRHLLPPEVHTRDVHIIRCFVLLLAWCQSRAHFESL